MTGQTKRGGSGVDRYRLGVRDVCIYVRTDKKGWIRGVQVNGRAERCVYVRTEMKGVYQGCTGIGGDERCMSGQTPKKSGLGVYRS